jgi:hypothetical protein
MESEQCQVPDENVYEVEINGSCINTKGVKSAGFLKYE